MLPMRTSNILSASDCLKMVWIDACLVSAKVVNFQPLRDRAKALFVVMTMRNRSSSVDGRTSVTVARRGHLPEPATSFGFSNVLDWRFALLVTSDKALGPSSDDPGFIVTVFCNRGFFTASAHAVRGRIRSFESFLSCGVTTFACFHSTNDASFLSDLPSPGATIGMKTAHWQSLFTAWTETGWGRIGMHLPSSFRWAPRLRLFPQRGGISFPQLYQFRWGGRYCHS